jgi:hypothetical protein
MLRPRTATRRCPSVSHAANSTDSDSTSTSNPAPTAARRPPDSEFARSSLPGYTLQGYITCLWEKDR